MHKITKGLKKKKKGKKSKKGEDDLFKPEELENYRREHQSSSTEPSGQNEEWKKFIALTSEVDDILKKTQGDLDRIKSTSFFQRKPTESEVKKLEEAKEQEAFEQIQEVVSETPHPPQPSGIVEVSDSESEEEENDTVFNTNYIDGIASGEVKLAYIPESPIDQPADDPFDTSIAERAILGPEVERKGRKLVPLGAAVEVLTGRVQLPTCATKRPTTKRQILKEKDLLLGSFDDPPNLNVEVKDGTEEIKKTLFDDDSIPLPEQPIDLSKPIIPPELLPTPNPTGAIKNLVSEPEDDDTEFEELATESLAKTIKPLENVKIEFNTEDTIFAFEAFETNVNQNNIYEDQDIIIDDPFDTSFAQNVLPGSVITGIESVLNNESFFDNVNNIKIDPESNLFEEDYDFNPRADEKPRERSISRPDVLNITGSARSVSFDLPSPEKYSLNVESKVIKPLTPFYTRKNSIPELPLQEVDPFDTSFAVNLAPGKAELKVIESELFDPNIEKRLSLIDRNFDPRDDRLDKINKVLNTVNEIAVQKINTLSESVDLLAIDSDISAKVLTPQESLDKDFDNISYRDPFDTSAISNILPGKTELRLLESELIYSGNVNEINDSGISSVNAQKDVVDDLLVQKEDIVIEKPLSPSGNFSTTSIDEQEDFDPFDTSCVVDIKPGKTELKLIESELIHK